MTLTALGTPAGAVDEPRRLDGLQQLDHHAGYKARFVLCTQRTDGDADGEAQAELRHQRRPTRRRQKDGPGSNHRVSLQVEAEQPMLGCNPRHLCGHFRCRPDQRNDRRVPPCTRGKRRDRPRIYQRQPLSRSLAIAPEVTR